MSSSLTSGPPGPSLAASCDKAAGAEPPKLVQRKNRGRPGPDLRRPEISPPYRYRHAVMMRFPLSSQAVLSIRLLLAK